MRDGRRYDTTLMARQVEDWYRAVDAYRRRDVEGTTLALHGVAPISDREHYGLQTTSIMLGATLAALHLLHDLAGEGLGSDAIVVAEAINPACEAPAAARLAADLVSIASHGTLEAQYHIGEIVLAYSTPDRAGMERMCELQHELLMILARVAP